MGAPQIFTFLDLEMNQPSGKIIQIGACVADMNTGAVLEVSRIYTQIDEPLSAYITTLTGITEEDLLTKGVSLIDGYRQLKEMHKKHDSFCNPVTWGGADSKALEAQVRAINPDELLCFGRRWIDVKTIYQCWRISQNEKIQSGLSKSLVRLGIHFKGTKHDALDDAINTFYAFKALQSKFKP